MSTALFGPEFERLLGAALRRVRALRGARDSELRALRQVGAPRGAFAGHRRYAAGDALRVVDWSAYARTRQLYSKIFEEDEHRSMVLLLDTSGSMAAGERDRASRRYAALVGAVALSRLDGLRLVLGPDDAYDLSGGAAVRELLEVLERAPIRDLDPVGLAAAAGRRGGSGGRIVWISDFAEPERAAPALAALRRSRSPGAVIGLLPTVREDRHPDGDGWVELFDPESSSIERMRIDASLRAAMAVQLELLANRQRTVFATAGARLFRTPVPAADDFRVESWLEAAWLSQL